MLLSFVATWCVSSEEWLVGVVFLSFKEDDCSL